MSSNEIVTAEVTTLGKGYGKIYVRFLKDLPLFRMTVIPSLILSFGAVLIPQAFLFFAGKYSECQNLAACEVQIPWFESVVVSISFLASLFILSFLLRFTSWALFEGAGELSAVHVHDRMVQSLGNTRVTYFDQNPSGRILNRVIRDWDILRREGITHLSDALQALLELIATALLSLFASVAAVIFLIPLLAVYIFIQMNISPMLLRLAQIKSSKLGQLLHRYTDYVEGIRTFIIYDRVKELTNRLAHASADYLQAHLVRARIENIGFIQTGFITAFYGFIVILSASYALHAGEISQTLAAVIMTVSFRIPPLANIFVWHSVYLVESMGYAKRVYDIIDLPEESLEEGKRAEQIAGLPMLGDIEFIDFEMSYRAESNKILEGLNLRIGQGERVGIVGRTGAGKSSILQSLLRMVYVHAGDIKIGGASIYRFTPQQIRELVTVVPQDPYLFQGTVASNISRNSVLPMERIQDALRRVGLNFAPEKPVEEGGKNLSLGERQLVCLARALVQNRPILFLDEPTSGIDTISDYLVQKVLTTEFTGITVITIAHRLDTLRSYDKIVLMEAGKVKMVGEPGEMLRSLSENDLV